MRKTHLNFSILAKMNGRNSRNQFAAYRSDGKRETPAEKKAREDKEEADFEKSIEQLTDENKDVARNVRKQMQDTLQKAQIDMVSKEEYDDAVEELKELHKSNAEALRIIKEAQAKQGVTVAGLKAGNGVQTTVTPLDQLKESILENRDKLIEIGKGASADEVVLKANVTRSSIATTNEAHFIDGIGQLIRKAVGIYDVCTKLQVKESNNQGIIHYVDWDEATVVKAASMVAEGATFLESTAAFKGYTLPLRKIGDTLPVTDEFFEDEELCAAELEMFLENNVNSKRDDQLINGDNTGQNLKGLLTTLTEYTQTAGGGPDDCNVYDLITKMITAISSNAGSKYKEFKAAMAKTTIDRLILKKNANGDYQFPPNHPIYSMIVEDNNVADNVIAVGDFRFARIYEKGGVVISKGEINAQFTYDLSTLKARKRMLFLIRAADASGFLKCSDVDAALANMTTQLMA